MNNSRSASAVILIRPTGFGYDPETAASNAFQQRLHDADVEQRAAIEFDGLLEALRQCGVGTTVLDPFSPAAPNAVFPNNWFSTHATGEIILYPMATPSRRIERDPAIALRLAQEGSVVSRLRDLSGWEAQGRILEGTGSLVLDRTHQFAYACLSPRTHEKAVTEWCREMGYTPVVFIATMDGTLSGAPVYHTNVVMSVGSRFAVVCLEAMPYPGERVEVVQELERTGRQVIAITLEQMHHYVGNMLELARATDQPLSPGLSPAAHFIFLSRTAYEALSPDQRTALETYAQLVPVAIPTIETVGGGSVRCMIAEDFLPRR